MINFNHTSPHALRNKKEILRYLIKVIDNGFFLEGLENDKLEKKILKLYLKSGYLTNVASGHDALYLAFSSLNLTQDDEILFPVNAYPTAFPIFLTKVEPVPVDVDENGQIDCKEVERKISKKTKVIVTVHLYGSVGDLDKLIKIAKKNKVILIEDCAQAFGTLYKNKPVGTFGDIGCFSFYPTKNLGTLGDGGAIWTKHKKLHDYFVQAKRYGEVEKYNSLFVSGHSRLPEIQAAILNLYIKNFKNESERKIMLYKYYLDKINDLGLRKNMRMLMSSKDSQPLIHLLVAEVKNRDGLRKYLKKKGIETLIHYPYTINQVCAFNKILNKEEKFPIAERLSKNIVSLPFHHYLTKKQIDFIVKNIKTFYA